MSLDPGQVVVMAAFKLIAWNVIAVVPSVHAPILYAEVQISHRPELWSLANFIISDAMATRIYHTPGGEEGVNVMEGGVEDGCHCPIAILGLFSGVIEVFVVTRLEDMVVAIRHDSG